LLFRVEVLPWDEQAATVYGDLRASCMSVGITLGALDMMIAVHATLVTHDKAFSLVPGGVLTIEDWLNGVKLLNDCGENKLLAVTSEAEQFVLYGAPDFNGIHRLEYLVVSDILAKNRHRDFLVVNLGSHRLKRCSVVFYVL